VSIWSVGRHDADASLQRFHQYYGEDLQVECPTGSGDVSYRTQVQKDELTDSS